MNSLPAIKRAKDCYLYTASGVRYIDLYMNNATATLGHRPTNFGLALKNPIDQGLTMAYPNLWHNRLYATLSKLYPRYKLYLYNNDELEDDVMTLKKQAVQPWQEGDCSFLRPLYDNATKESHIYLPSIPLSLATIVLSKKDLPNPKTVLPAFMARAILRFLNRRALISNPLLSPLFDQSPLWQRHQAYVTSTLKTDQEYSSLFNLALKNQIFLPPTREGVGLISATLSHGETEKLKRTILS